MSYKDRCRTCLGRSKEMRHIYTTISVAGSDVRLYDILRNFYNFEITPQDHSYPENLCMSCIHHLTLTHSFKTLIESSSKTLAEIANVGNASDNYDCDLFDYDDINYKPTENKIQKYELPKRDKIKTMKLKRQVIKICSEPAKQLFCVECKAKFHTMKSLREHCMNNHPVKSTVGRDCDYCNEKFEDFQQLIVHRKLHLSPYICNTCWTGFETEADYETHKCQPNLSRRKTGEKELQQCDQCGKSYLPGYIKVHMATHSNIYRYSCKYCPKKFKVANGLNSHVLWNHKRTRDHKCEVCGAMFISSSARSCHIRKNHLKEKKYGCENCGKRFFSKSELERHMLTHTGVKNFHCHACDKSYQTRYGLNVHLKSHAHMVV